MRFMQSLGSRLFRRFDEALTREIKALIRDDAALSLLQPYIADYIPWSGAALRPATVCTILNDIALNHRRLVVEFGSGISTYFIAQALGKFGGEIVSFDDDVGWQNFLRERMFRSKAIADRVTLVPAGLKQCHLSLDGALWYDMAVVEKALPKRSIDLCLVDGPASYQLQQSYARYPAIPAIKNRLGKSYSIYLDDVVRKGEAEVFKRWQADLGIGGDIFPDRGGFGLIRTPGTYFPVF